MSKPRTYIAIDLKSFYASVECVERGLNPLTTRLVVADVSRTEKTICLAVSPSLKAYGLPGRPRLFEVVQKMREVGCDFITAVPRMACYIAYSCRIYEIYLKYVAAEDIHVYSIDEVFMDVTGYLDTYRVTARELAVRIIRDVLRQTGITATAGIGTNLYLCKVAMDIVAKHLPADSDGVRVAELDEMSYRRLLWDHQPLTDFWRVGRGTASRLALYGIRTMGQLARFSLTHEEVLYKLFGVNAELLIDHAWGWEPCTMAHIKAYRPESNSIGSGQVLTSAYSVGKARVVVQEMADALALDLVDKGRVADQLVLTVGYDVASLTDPTVRDSYQGAVSTDYYGRKVPRHAHGSIGLGRYTASGRLFTEAVLQLFDRVVQPELLVRRLYLTANHVVDVHTAMRRTEPVQLDLFDDPTETSVRMQEEQERLDKEYRIQQALLSIKKKFGKNAVLRGLNFAEGATGRERNCQIGGHKA